MPVEDLREHVAADDERVLREPGRDHRVRLRDRVHEAGAAGEQVVGGRVGHPERVGEQRRAGREHHVRRHRRDDDQVDRRRRRRRRSPAPRRGRGQRDVGQRLAPSPRTAARGCRCARRSTRPSCRRYCSRSSFVKTRSGTWHAEAGDRRSRSPFARADHDDRSTAKVSVPRTASSPFTVARALPLPIGPRTSRARTRASARRPGGRPA